MATKSLLTHVEVDTAKHSHNCQGNARHRINMGDPRLKVRTTNGRSWDHYCIPCAKTIVQRGRAQLQQLEQRLQAI